MYNFKRAVLCPSCERSESNPWRSRWILSRWRSRNGRLFGGQAHLEKKRRKNHGGLLFSNNVRGSYAFRFALHSFRRDQ